VSTVNCTTLIAPTLPLPRREVAALHPTNAHPVRMLTEQSLDPPYLWIRISGSALFMVPLSHALHSKMSGFPLFCLWPEGCLTLCTVKCLDFLFSVCGRKVKTAVFFGPPAALH
jgi:hypothetical protein